MNEWLRHATQGSLLALASCALFFAPAAITHAAGWSTQTTGATWNIEGINFVNENNGIAVGANGKTLYTANGGATWKSGAAVSGSNTLYDIAWGDASAYAVGAAGTIAVSNDFGATWTTQASGTTSSLYGVVFDGDLGLAVGTNGLVLRTVDGGASWNAQTSGVTAKLYDVQYRDNTAVAVGANGTVIYSIDTGKTWSVAASSVTTDLFAVDFLPSFLGGYSAIAVGSEATYLESTDLATWTSDPTGASTTQTFYDVVMNNSPLDPIIVADGLVATSYHEGADWLLDSIGTGLNALSRVVDSETVWVAGNSGKIYVYSDAEPVISKITPATATVDVEETFSVTVSSLSDINSCYVYIGDASRMPMTLASGTASFTHTFTNDGSKTVTVECEDFYLTDGISGTVIEISEAPVPDTTAPTVGVISPLTATAGASTTFSATYSDAVGVESCALYINGVSTAAMTLSSGTATASYTPSSVSTFTAQAKCTDAAGNVGSGTSKTVSATADTTAPTVSGITPTTATAGTASTLSVTYSDNVGVTGCTLYIGGVSQGAMTLASGTASKSHTFASSGTSNAKAICADAAGNSASGTVTSITISASTGSTDSTAPSVGSITPTTAIVGTSVTLSATYSDAVGVTGCSITIDGTTKAMSLASGTATYVANFSTSGTTSVIVSCVDAAGNSGTKTTTITITAASTDTTAPTVSAITPASATALVSTTFSATYSDNVGVTTCIAAVEGEDKAMSLASGTASAIGAFDAAGSYTVVVSCSDAAGNKGTSTTVITVAAASTDTTAPTVSTVTPVTATQDTAATFTVTATDSSGINSCRLYVDGSDQGPMTAGSSNTFNRSYTFSSSGSHSAYANCGDAVGNIATGTTATITVAAAAVSTTDITAPTVSAISPSTATEDTAVTMSASVSDSVGVTNCTLYVNSTNAGSMTISGGYATASYTFTAAGTGIANAYCTDAVGNATRGASTTFTIAAAAVVEEEAEDEAAPGSLIKLACSSDSDVNDPCRAVYFYAEQDGKRHAFPNEKVFFGWYTDFDDVIVVTDDFMASLTLGRNVTYKPGVTMVKFITVNTVYAVGEAGELRAIDSEDTARSIWGTDWNTQIQDISDAFYSNYEFGEDIDSTSDYDSDSVEDAVDTIDELLAVS